MKKLLPVLFCFIFFQSEATTWTVSVENVQFVPKNLNVIVGDVIHFVWVNGGHTTSSISVPSGAATWDALINSLDKVFDYTVTTAGTYNYYCKIHGVVAMPGSFTATEILPVTLSAFNISTQNNKPFLSWTTQTEFNVNYFSVRKSINGTDFKEIGKVPAANNSANRKSYSFTDETSAAGTNYVYYALAIVDKDGKTELTPIKIYKNKKAVPKLIISLSPNPVSGMGHLMLQFNADKTGTMIAKMIDMQGKVVLKTELSAEQGVNNAHIHLGDLAAGIYTIYFSLDGISESYRVVKN